MRSGKLQQILRSITTDLRMKLIFGAHKVRAPGHVALGARSPGGACTCVSALLWAYTHQDVLLWAREPKCAQLRRMQYGCSAIGACNPKRDSCYVCIPECAQLLAHGGSMVLTYAIVSICGACASRLFECTFYDGHTDSWRAPI